MAWASQQIGCGRRVGPVPSANPLYRQQVIAARFDTRYGPGIDTPPLNQPRLVALTGGIVAAIIALLYFGHYTGRQTVRGVVTTTAGNVQVFARGNGIVSDVLVQDGAPVARGTPLLRVTTGRLPPGRNTDTDLLESLLLEQAAIASQTDATDALQQSRSTALNAQLIAAKRNTRLLEAQLSITDNRLAVQQDEVRALGEVAAQGHVAAVEVQQRQLRLLDAQQARVGLERELTAERARMLLLQAEHADLPLQLQQERAALAIATEQISQRVAVARADQAQLVRAPIAGTVSALAVRLGDAVSNTRALLTLLPASATYYVELVVPDRSIGFIKAGDAVRLRVDAYPFQKFGAIAGQVTEVSASPISFAQQQRNTREAGYLVKVRLDSQVLRQGVETLALQAGMSVSADVLRERRRLGEWLLQPLISVARSP